MASTDDGYDRYRDDRDGSLSALEELDRQMELAKQIAERAEKWNEESRRKRDLKKTS